MRFLLRILTPELDLFQDHVDSVQVPAVDGVYELLYDHAPVYIALQAGSIVVRQSSETEEWFINGGTCHMENNVCTLLARTIIDMDEVELDTLVSELNTARTEPLSPNQRQLLEAQIASKTSKI